MSKYTKEYELGDVCDIISGIPFKPGDYTETGDPVIKAKNIQDGKILLEDSSYYDSLEQSIGDEFKTKTGDIVITKAGMSVGKIGINLSNTIFLNSAVVFKLEPKRDLLNKKYLYHVLLNSKNQIENLVTIGIVKNLYRSSLSKLKVIVPTIEEQNRIASILDKFSDAGIYGELEKEISLRHDQYEYYRDHLIVSSKEI